MARLHDLPADLPVSERIAALARRLADPSGLESVLAKRLGSSEREILAAFLPHGRVDLGSRRGKLDATLAVHWDWEAGIPVASGGRLRAFGLVFVGHREGKPVAEVPPAMRQPLWSALQAADPELIRARDQAARGLVAQRLKTVPQDDAEHERWSAHERAVTRRFQEWIKDDATSAAFDAFFAGGPRQVRTEVDTQTLIEFSLLDWRAGPSEATVAERRLAAQPFRDPERQALAEAVLAARPGLYRVESVRRGKDLTLRPLFPPGEFVVVTDRAASLTAEVGWLIGARVYRAGPFTFCRIFGNPLPEREERGLLRELSKGYARHVKSSGRIDPAAYVRENPTALLHAIRSRELVPVPPSSSRPAPRAPRESSRPRRRPSRPSSWAYASSPTWGWASRLSASPSTPSSSRPAWRAKRPNAASGSPP
jgi:hypothetical protein